MLRHFLAAIAYRAQKALRDAPDAYADFHAGMNVRTPHRLVWHITSVLGYARTLFLGGTWRPPLLPTFREEVARLHEVIEDLGRLIENGAEPSIRPEQLLQGPLSDAMTHVARWPSPTTAGESGPRLGSGRAAGSGLLIVVGIGSHVHLVLIVARHQSGPHVHAFAAIATWVHMSHQHPRMPVAHELPRRRLLIRRQHRERVTQLRVIRVMLFLHDRMELPHAGVPMATELHVHRVEARAHGFVPIGGTARDRGELHDLLVGELERSGVR
jgi:hypothetical protein